MALQQTIGEKVSCTGIGLHTGVRVQLSLHPARANTGIVFARRDCDVPGEILASPSSVVSTSHATTIASREDRRLRVTTVEHLLAALYALEINNVRVELDGPEIPAMDGSAAPFVELIRTAGIFEQNVARPTLRVLRPIEVANLGRRIRIEPARNFQVSYTIDFEHPAIRHQAYSIDCLDADSFERELASARTFGFLHEVSALLLAGFARGGSLENTVVLDDERVLNTDGLRWPEEFVRHKMVDLLGDLALLGLPLQGRVEVERGGHELHQMLVQAILRTPDAWSLVGEDPAVPRDLDLTPRSILPDTR